MTLFELTEDFLNLIDMGYPEITDKDNEETRAEKESEISTFNDTLNMILECIGDKADNYCYALSTVKGKSDMLKTEINRLTAMKKALDNAEKRMKEGLKNTLIAMRESGAEPVIRTDLHTIKLKKNGGLQPMTVIEESVPDSFKKVILETDKEKIRKALENGEELKFAHLDPRGESVSIK